VAHAVALEEPAARQAGVSLELEIEPDLEVEGDALALSRVIANLLGNALRYSPRGGVVSVHLVSTGGDACCRVRDRGPGIPVGAEDAIFQRGMQAGDRIGRMGLGLTIARRIVEQHGGRIEARSPGDRGAEILFVLPVAR
jgi:signal transduction histidine kinase